MAASNELPPLESLRPLFWLALGTFAMGTEGFMIAPLLPGIAADLAVGVAAAGQLVTAFAITYALSSPLLATMTAGFHRRHVLVAALALFTLANLLAWSANGYWTLLVARVLLALAAGVYVPAANAVASALVSPTRRGIALAIVNGGLTIAITLGVPLGAMLGSLVSWRATFLAVAVLGALATIALAIGLPNGFGDHLLRATLRERLEVASHGAVLRALLVTATWAMGTYCLYTYIAVFLGHSTTVTGTLISGALFAWGLSAATGLFIGGRFTDRYGAGSVMVPALLAMVVSFVGLWATATYVSKSEAWLPVMALIVVWGVSAWAFLPAQQARIVELAGVRVAPISMSLNAAFMYIGFSQGAALGAFTILHGSPADLGWVSAICELLCLALLLRPGSNNPVRSSPA